jgi:hypothetical protein
MMFPQIMLPKPVVNRFQLEQLFFEISAARYNIQCHSQYCEDSMNTCQHAFLLTGSCTINVTANITFALHVR